jgi:hypothetical protein
MSPRWLLWAREHVADSAHQPVPATQACDLQQEGPPDELRAQASSQLPGRPSRTTRGQNIVHHEHSAAAIQRVSMGLE